MEEKRFFKSGSGFRLIIQSHKIVPFPVHFSHFLFFFYSLATLTSLIFPMKLRSSVPAESGGILPLIATKTTRHLKLLQAETLPPSPIRQ